MQTINLKHQHRPRNMSSPSQPAISAEMTALSDYIAAAGARALPSEVVDKTKHHVLDTLAAMVSGSRLKAGKLAAGYAKRVASPAGEATVIGTALLAPVEFAALANGMAGPPPAS